MSNSEKETTSSLKWGQIVLIIVVCVILWIGGIWGVHCLAPKLSNGTEYANVGILGDSAGAINALFSALAFCGVVIAIILQKEELGLQRKELKATNDQLQAQKEEFQTQNETLKRQRFENTFFQMMNLQQEIVNNLSFSYKTEQITTTDKRKDTKSKDVFNSIENLNDPPKESTTIVTEIVRGRDVFSRIFNKANTIIKDEDGKQEKSVEGVREAINQKGIGIYNRLTYPEFFDHYFRHLYRIIKFVDESDLIESKDRYSYIGIVRATLSRYELVWLFYNCLPPNGNGKFKPLIERYALLRNLRDDLLAKKEHKSQYENGAYDYKANLRFDE
jgi:hypothetical protein